MSGEHFVPFSKADVISICAGELPPEQRRPYYAFVALLSSLVHQRFQARIDDLLQAYRPFNLDADTQTVATLDPAQRQAARQRIEAELARLAVAANYTEIDTAELSGLLDKHSLLKVKLTIDMSVIDKVMLFRRGESTRSKQVPAWFGLRQRVVTFDNYARVLVYATFADQPASRRDVGLTQPGAMIVKLFQNVPRDDLEMVFPNVQVRMRLIDKLFIGVPAVISGAVVVATKLVTSLWLLLLLIGFWIGVNHQPVHLNQAAVVSISAGVIAFGAYVARQISKFKNRKIMFMKALSENLYFRTLDNDAGVFHHLLGQAEEAELIEALLAYHFLLTAGEPLTALDLDRRIEECFLQRWGAAFDFEVDDGLRKLRELGLLVTEPDGRLRVIALEQAKQRLEMAWENAFLDPTALPSQVGVAANR